MYLPLVLWHSIVCKLQAAELAMKPFNFTIMSIITMYLSKHHNLWLLISDLWQQRISDAILQLQLKACKWKKGCMHVVIIVNKT